MLLSSVLLVIGSRAACGGRAVRCNCHTAVTHMIQLYILLILQRL